MDIKSVVVREAMLRTGITTAAFDEWNGSMSHGAVGDFLAGACYMAELFAAGQGALRETLEAIRADLTTLKAARPKGEDS